MVIQPQQPPLPRDEEPKIEGGAPPFKMNIRHLMYRLVFPSLKNRGKREYFTILIIRISTYMAIGYGFAILFGVLYHLLQELFTIQTVIWSPDSILILPFTFAFEGSDTFELVTNFAITAFIPFLIAGIVSGILWRDESRDVIIPSIVVSLILFLLLYLSQIVLFSTSTAVSISGFFSSYYFLGFVVIFAFMLTLISSLGGAVGVNLGILISNIARTKRGSKVAYSHLLLPKLPLSVRTIFDLDEPPKRSERQISALSMIYLNRTVNLILRRSNTETCIYFEDGKCAYLGYLTATHKYQVCITRYWPLCKVYAFLRQSNIIIDAVQKGENNEN